MTAESTPEHEQLNYRRYRGVFVSRGDDPTVYLEGDNLDIKSGEVLGNATLRIKPLDIFGNIPEDTSIYEWTLSMLGQEVEVYFKRSKETGSLVFVCKDSGGQIQSREFENIRITPD